MFQKIVGKRCRIVPLAVHDELEADALAPIPTGSEPRFVVEAERDGVLEGDDGEAPFADGFEERRLEQQAVGVGREGQAPRESLMTFKLSPPDSPASIYSTCGG